MIPKIIHRIWIQGYDAIDDSLKVELDNCVKINNDFTHYVWDESHILKLLESFNPSYINMYHGYEQYAQKADLARYVILYVFGGVYLDMDMVCFKNLKTLLHHPVFVTKPPLVKSIQNCVIGIVPNHILMEIALRLCVERIDDKSILRSTGPAMLYDAIKEYGDVEIIERKYLYPCLPHDPEWCSYVCDSCYVSHIAHASWHKRTSKPVRDYLRNNQLAIVSSIVAVMYVLVIGSTLKDT